MASDISERSPRPTSSSGSNIRFCGMSGTTAVVFVGVFSTLMDFMLFSTLNPLLPLYFQQLFDFNSMQTGAILSLYAVGYVIGALGCGWMADQINRRTPFIVSLGLMAGALAMYEASSFLYGGPAYFVLCFGRVLHGLGGGGVALLALVLISDCFDGADAKIPLAAVSAAMGIGLVVGASSGLVLYQFVGFQWLVVFLGCLLAIDGVLRFVAIDDEFLQKRREEQLQRSAVALANEQKAAENNTVADNSMIIAVKDKVQGGKHMEGGTKKKAVVRFSDSVPQETNDPSSGDEQSGSTKTAGGKQQADSLLHEQPDGNTDGTPAGPPASGVAVIVQSGPASTAPSVSKVVRRRSSSGSADDAWFDDVWTFLSTYRSLLGSTLFFPYSSVFYVAFTAIGHTLFLPLFLSTEYNADSAWIGLIIGMGALFLILGNPLAVLACRRWNLAALQMIAIGVNGLNYLLYFCVIPNGLYFNTESHPTGYAYPSLTSALPILLPLMIIHGLTMSVVAVCTPIEVNEILSSTQQLTHKGHGFALQMTFSIIGMFFGQLCTGVVYNFGGVGAMAIFSPGFALLFIAMQSLRVRAGAWDSKAQQAHETITSTGVASARLATAAGLDAPERADGSAVAAAAADSTDEERLLKNASDSDATEPKRVSSRKVVLISDTASEEERQPLIAAHCA